MPLTAEGVSVRASEEVDELTIPSGKSKRHDFKFEVLRLTMESYYE